jgi:S1-C subfamily serine protease
MLLFGLAVHGCGRVTDPWPTQRAPDPFDRVDCYLGQRGVIDMTRTTCLNEGGRIISSAQAARIKARHSIRKQADTREQYELAQNRGPKAGVARAGLRTHQVPPDTIDGVVAYNSGDYDTALRELRPLAEQGNAYAQVYLGLMRYLGDGVPQDHVLAHMWFNVAASRFPPGENRETAAALRQTVEEEMESGIAGYAYELAMQWKPSPAGEKVSPAEKAGAGIEPSPAKPPVASRKTVRRIQGNLARLGYDSGPADGVAGHRTRAAISSFQKDYDLPVTGEPSEELEMALRAVVAGREKFVRHEPEKPKLEKYGTASGFVVTSEGHVLTNDHVVDDCREVRLPLNVMAQLVARDEENDLALLQDADSSRSSATFGQGRGARPGDDVVVAGYPLQGVLTSDLSITTGTVSALAGPGNDRRYLQITAPVQQGNSGGPLLDLAGNVVGVVVGKLDALMVAGLTGDIPQNVNFAISAWTARAFLDAHNVPYETAPPEPRLTAREVAAKAQDYTVLVECWR